MLLIIVIKKIQALFAFVPNKSLNQLLDISSENVIFLKASDCQFLHIEIQFTDQNSNPLEIEDKIIVTLIINESATYINDTLSV